jgi:hypothetical protein
MRSAQALTLIRRLARQRKLTVMPLPGRGKGSHEIYVLADASGAEVARFGLTGHRSKDLSGLVLRRLEERLEPVFGEKWTER